MELNVQAVDPFVSRAIPDKVLLFRAKRRNSRLQFHLHPTKAKSLPYFDDISFSYAPCLDPKTNRISIDTGSSDTWLNGLEWCTCSKASLDIASQNWCKALKKIESERPLDYINYDDDLHVGGFYLKNGQLYFGRGETGLVLSKVTFLAGTSFSGPNAPGTPNGFNGTMGMGYPRAQQRQNYRYENLPGLMQRNNHISSQVFTMWFENDLKASEAEAEVDDFPARVLFGGSAEGIQKQIPQWFPILPDEHGEHEEIIIWLDRISVKSPLKSPAAMHPERVLLDTGSYSSYLPAEVFLDIAKQLGHTGLVYNNDVRMSARFSDCARLNWANTVNFHFGKLEIAVPLTDIVRPVTEKEQEKFHFAPNECITHGTSPVLNKMCES